mgnify:CR=1 FL=1
MLNPGEYRNGVTSSTLLVLLASVVASAKPAWPNCCQHRGTTYSYNNGSKKRGKIDGRVLPYQLQAITTTQWITA